MIRLILNKQINRMEKELGVPVDEARYMVEHSLKAFFTCGSVRKIANYHGTLPPEVYFAAKIAAYRQEDCGSCLQICVNFAKKAGVRAELLRDLLAGRVQALSSELRDVYRFAEDQANRTDNPELRERLRALYGDEGLISLGLAIASVGIFPRLKRSLGYARTCSQVRIVA